LILYGIKLNRSKDDHYLVIDCSSRAHKTSLASIRLRVSEEFNSVSADRVALVVGDSGLVGSNLVKHLSSTGRWRVIGASRAPDSRDGAAIHLSIDLADPESVSDKLAAHPDITHIFMAARLKGTAASGHEKTAAQNAEILRVVLDAVEPVAANLKHVHLVHGTKWYGPSVGPVNAPVPVREDSPRRLGLNPYHAQQDYLVRRQQGKRWTWSAIRPPAILGYAPGYPHNLVALVGAYAAICRHQNVPLRFPGTERCFELIQSGVTVDILCEASEWIAEHEECANEAFNVTNGDVYRWADLWPKVARFFDMPTGDLQTLNFSAVMHETDGLWDEIVSKNGLDRISLSQLIDWEYGDYHFHKTKGDISSVIKLAKTGFRSVTDTDQAFLDALQKYRDAKLLP
jgi:nucleoside-diphosphate-sugar epimerase